MGTEMQGSSDAAPKEAAKEPKGDSRLADHLRKHASEYLRHYPWDWADEAQELLKEAASVIDASAAKQLAAYRVGVTHMKPEITSQELDEECESLAALLRDKCQVSKQQNLTPEEREAIKVCESDYSDNDMDAACWKIAATLRGLLSRTGTNSRQTSDNAVECTDQEGKTPERDRRNG